MIKNKQIESLLQSEIGCSLTKSPATVSGGDINEVYRLDTDMAVFCLKCNNAPFSKDMFQTELNGLDILDANTSFRIPNRIGFYSMDSYYGLLLEWIDSGNTKPDFWEHFGRSLALMHRSTDQFFGLSTNNYIGTLTQSNTQHDNWTDFYILERLKPLFEKAYDRGLFDSQDTERMEQLYRQIDNLYPDEPPALLHGDLWSGNYMCDHEGNPVLIDPAVYFGHREIDIAMTKLFGGFGQRMYEAYHEVYPLESSWHERIPINQLYPLLVHVNLFGGHYVNQVQSVISRYI